jgi:hypothetical protein
MEYREIVGVRKKISFHLKNPKGRVPRAVPVGECNGVVLIHDTVIQYTALGQAKLEL